MASVILLGGSEQARPSIEAQDITADTVWNATSSPVYVNQTIMVHVSNHLMIQGNVTLLFQPGASIILEGNLTMDGMNGTIVMDRNLNADKNLTWDGIVVQNPGSIMSINNVIFYNASTGITVADGELSATNTSFFGLDLAILLSDQDNATAQVSNCTFNCGTGIHVNAGTLKTVDIKGNLFYSGDAGINAELGNGTVSIEHSRFYNMSTCIDLKDEISISMNNSELAFSNLGAGIHSIGNLAWSNSIHGNKYGINVTDNGYIDASQNYWGASSGPYHQYLLPNGEGDSINGSDQSIEFLPWLAASPISDYTAPEASLSSDSISLVQGGWVNFSSGNFSEKVVLHRVQFGDWNTSEWYEIQENTTAYRYLRNGTFLARADVVDELGVLGSSNTIAIHVLPPDVTPPELSNTSAFGNMTQVQGQFNRSLDDIVIFTFNASENGTSSIIIDTNADGSFDEQDVNITAPVLAGSNEQSWDVVYNTGFPVFDGTYMVRIQMVDNSGNPLIQPVDTVLNISTWDDEDPELLSPLAVGSVSLEFERVNRSVDDNALLQFNVSEPCRYLVVVDTDKPELFNVSKDWSFKGNAVPGEEVEVIWPLTTRDGTLVQDGNFGMSILLEDLAHNTLSPPYQDIILNLYHPDETMPQLTSVSIFGRETYYNRKMNLTMEEELVVRFMSTEKGTYRVIVDTDGNEGYDTSTDVVFQDSINANTLVTIYWDGNDAQGKKVKKGTYGLRIELEDISRNKLDPPYTTEVEAYLFNPFPPELEELEAKGNVLEEANTLNRSHDTGVVITFMSSEKGTFEIIIDTNQDPGFDYYFDFLLEGNATGGMQSVLWNGSDREGKELKPGSYPLRVNLYDAQGKVMPFPNTSLVLQIVAYDSQPPVISSLSARPKTSNLGSSVNFSALILEDSAMDLTFLQISGPEDLNLTMKYNDISNIAWVTSPFSTTGIFTFKIWCRDLYGNTANSEIGQFIVVDQYSSSLYAPEGNFGFYYQGIATGSIQIIDDVEYQAPEDYLDLELHFEVAHQPYFGLGKVEVAVNASLTEQWNITNTRVFHWNDSVGVWEPLQEQGYWKENNTFHATIRSSGTVQTLFGFYEIQEGPGNKKGQNPYLPQLVGGLSAFIVILVGAFVYLAYSKRLFKLRKRFAIFNMLRHENHDEKIASIDPVNENLAFHDETGEGPGEDNAFYDDIEDNSGEDMAFHDETVDAPAEELDESKPEASAPELDLEDER